MKKEIRIAVLGAASHVDVKRWCEGLRNAGADVHLISHHQNLYGFQPFYPIQPPFLLSKLVYISGIHQLRRHLEAIQPDILICYYITGYGTLGRLAQFHPLVQMAVGSDVLIAPKYFMMRTLLRHNIRNAQYVIALAPHLAQSTMRLGADPKQIVILPLGIERDIFYPSGQRDIEKIRIISTRSLYPLYNLDVMIKAAAILKKMRVAVEMTIVGDGILKEKLQILITELRVTDIVKLTGRKSNLEVAQLLRDHNTYVSLASSDGVSSSLLEAMASGLYPIITDHPANRSWITTGENGTLLASIDAETLAYTIIGISNKPDAYVRAEKQNLELIMRSGDIAKNSVKYLEIFRSLVKEGDNDSTDN